MNPKQRKNARTCRRSANAIARNVIVLHFCGLVHPEIANARKMFAIFSVPNFILIPSSTLMRRNASVSHIYYLYCVLMGSRDCSANASISFSGCGGLYRLIKCASLRRNHMNPKTTVVGGGGANSLPIFVRRAMAFHIAQHRRRYVDRLRREPRSQWRRWNVRIILFVTTAKHIF